MIAQLTTTMISIAQNVYGSKGSSKKSIPAEELIPWSDTNHQQKDKPVQTIEDVKEIFRGIAEYLKESKTGTKPEKDPNKEG
jgi:hypothetical protein